MIDDPREPIEGSQEGDAPEPEIEDTPGQADQDADTDTTSDPEPSEQPSGRLDRRDAALQERIREAHAAEERVRLRIEEADRRDSYSRQQSSPDLSQMDPEARLRYENQRDIAQVRNENIASQFRTSAQLDQMSFDSKYGSNSGYRKYHDDIEKQYQSQLNNAMRAGRPDWILPREIILKQLVGDDVVKNGEKALRTARETGQRNIQRQTTKTGNVSGNVRPSKSQDSAAEASLKRMRAAGVLEE